LRNVRTSQAVSTRADPDAGVWSRSKSQVKSLVRPPRLGGDKVGLFATRTPHRPNPIGLSLVKLERIKDGVLYFSGIDLLDGTPILDVKPYLPPTDSVPPNLARAAAWFEELPGVDNATVTINQPAEQQLRHLVHELEFYDTYDDTWAAIREILRFDIRSLTMKQAVGRGGGGGSSLAGDSCFVPDGHASGLSPPSSLLPDTFPPSLSFPRSPSRPPLSSPFLPHPSLLLVSSLTPLPLSPLFFPLRHRLSPLFSESTFSPSPLSPYALPSSLSSSLPASSSPPWLAHKRARTHTHTHTHMRQIVTWLLV
jgi:hypothetical protein